ncbi:hypothetical protein BGW42_002218 [Actinomortierella wolfii]|nr:hypothetical protein BGW42_002218 [Actinomortierella wolfii]
MVGFLGARGHVDESFIRSILNAAAKQETQRRKRLGISQKVSPKLCIMDARGYSSAIANGVHGGGHENPDNYLNASITFMSLANIHVIASSHLSLLKAVQSSADSTNWFSALENTAWLTHVSELLKAASSKDGVVGKMTRENSSVLVHCSDGWDRTTQLVSLAQIIMDPYFRTIRGLRALIEKEWLFYGHPFQARNDSQQQRFVKHHISSLGQDSSIPSAGAQERSSGGWASGGPPVLLSSPNGKSERLSAIPNLSSLSRPIWKKVANKDDGDSPAWTKSLDISKADWSHPPRHSTDGASNASESYVYPPSSWNKSRLSKDAKAPTKDVNNPNVVQPKTNPSPIFLLFLTCLHHILEQHPDHFEYNDYLLMLLAKAASGFTPFGDFLFNSERERAQSRLRENTVSVWAWIDCHRGLVTHPGYIGRDRAQGTDDSDPLSTSVLEVQTGGRYISIWSEYYFDTLLSSATYPFDPSTIMSSPMFHPHAPTSRARNSLTTDFWRATLLTPSNDRGMPTATDFHFAQPVPLRANKRATLNSAAATQTINPSYASDSTTQHTQSIRQHLELVRWRHIRDQHENEHLLLVHFLRRKRKARVDQVFSKWAEWAKKQREVQTARDAGWIVDYNDAQNDTHRRRGRGGSRHVYSDGDNSEDQMYADGEQSVYGRTVRPGPLDASPTKEVTAMLHIGLHLTRVEDERTHLLPNS